MKVKNIKQNRLYDEFAHLWSLVSPPEDYAVGAVGWREILREKLGPGRHEILELGVGGGHNLSHLTGDFQATAVDLSKKMLANSIKLNPGVEHLVGDMRTVRLGRKFKAVLIHDAINYMLTEDDLRATFATAAAHLDPGGVFIAAPDNFRETFQNHKVGHDTNSDGSVTLTYVEYQYDRDPNDTVVESIIIYLICENGDIRVEHDRHIIGLFPIQTWFDLMEEAGFAAEKRSPPAQHDTHQHLLVGALR